MMTDIDYNFDQNQTFREKKEEIKRLFKQLPSDLRNEILKELQTEQESLSKLPESNTYFPDEFF